MTAIGFLLIYLGGLLGALYAPILGVFAYIVVYFLHPQSRWWGGSIPDLRYGFMLALVVLGAFLLSPGVSRLGSVLSHRVVRLWIALVILNSIAGFWAVNPNVHAEFAINYIKVLVIGVVTICLIDDFKTLVVLMFVILFGEFYLGWEAYNIGRTGGGRLEGIGPPDSPDANGIAALIASCIPWLFAFGLFGNKVMRALSIAFAPFILNAVVLLNSRGAFLAIVAGVGYFLWLLFTDRDAPRQAKRAGFAACLLGVFAFLYLADVTFWERMGTLVGIEMGEDGQLQGDESAVSRTVYWSYGWDMALHNPLGLGTHGFQVESAKVLPKEWLGRTGGGRALHSIWMETLVELGWLGLLLWLLLLHALFRTLRAARAAAAKASNVEAIFYITAVTAGVIVLLVAHTFLDRLRSEMFYWNCVIAVAAERVLTARLAEVGAKREVSSGEPAPDVRRRRSIYWRDVR